MGSTSQAAATWRRFAWAPVLVCLLASPVFAQQGQINGVVSDSSGGVIPGVMVTAIETNTGFTREAVTGPDGRFSFTSLRPTVYDLTAELQGFRSYQRKGMALQADQALTVNIMLEVGNLSETVTVGGEAASVNVTTATIAEVVDSKRIAELPLNGRDAAQLSTLVAGTILAQVNQDTGKTIPGALRLSTNGGLERQVTYRLDGTSHTDPYYEENQPFPFPDALQEFSIQTANYSAAQGNRAGAVVNAVTKSGTNALHGGAFGYLRDRTFNAKNFFAKEKDFLKRNQYGGYLGGPLQTNQTFYFVAWQGTSIKNRGGDISAFGPTLDQRNGNFATCGNPCAKPITDPLTGRPFPNNQIPVSRFDPAAAAVLKYMPELTGTGQTLIVRNIAQRNDQIIGKVDHQLTGKDQISGRYFIERFTNAPIYNDGNLLTYRSGSLQSVVRSQNMVGSWNRTFSSTILNEFHVGYNGMNARRMPPVDVPSMKDLNVRLPLYPTLPSIQSVAVTGFFTVGDNPEARLLRHGLEFNNRTTWVKGRHSLQFGAEAQSFSITLNNEFQRPGVFAFDGSVTGNAMADFFLGKLGRFDQGTGEYKDYRILYASAFFQDDYKVADRVTLNLGLRYEPAPPWHEVMGRFDRFRIEDYQAGVRSTQFKNAPVGETFRGDPGVPEDGTTASMMNFGPRVGFAWDITGDGKTSLRGGGGMFFDQHRDGESGNGAVNTPPWSIRLSVTRPQGPFSDPYAGRSDFDVITPASIGSPDAPFPKPVVINSTADTYKTPRTYNFNLTLEREVSNGLMVRAAYVGSRNRNGRYGVGHSAGIELNPAVYAPGATTATTDARRLFAAAGIGSVTQQVQDRESAYNSLQLTASKRYARGLQITSNYTLSKVEGNFDPGLMPWYMAEDRSLTWGPLDQDHRHRLTVSWVWDLPGAKLTGPARWIAGGWQWTGVMQYQTGQPYTVTSGRDNSLDGISGDRAKLTGVSIEPPAGSMQTAWFNPAAFAVNDPGTFGDVGKGAYYGPPLHSWDMGLFKNFRMQADRNVQFRVEMFNIFNQVNFNLPGTNVSGGGFGTISATNPNSGDPRILQFGLKFVF